MIALITGLADDSQSIRSTIHQLISLGIPFRGWKEQHLSSAIPADLEKFDALIMDEKRFRAMTEMERIQVEAYARKHFVHIIPESYEQTSPWECEGRSEVDMHFFAAGSGIPRPGMEKIETSEILKGYFRIMEEFMAAAPPYNGFNEYHLHCTESLLESEKHGVLPDGWERRINDLFRSFAPLVHEQPVFIDEIAAWKFAPLSVERLGKRDFLDKALQAADGVIRSWIRSDLGLLSMCGRSEDPISWQNQSSPFFGTTLGTTGPGNLHLNEQLHYFGAAFPGLTVASGDPRFLEETLRLMRHVDTVHRDPADGLLRHASLHGKAIGEKWGRGVTHALLGAFYVAKESALPEEVRKLALDFLNKTGAGLLKYQTAGGLWRNVIDREDTPEETSCSVLITWIYAYCTNRGWFPRDRYAKMVKKSSDALKRKFWRGCGSGNCRGSLPSPLTEYYLRRPLHMYMMPLIAPALLESDRLGASTFEP